jgi:phosphinothricin acetyltransferase
MSSLTIRPATPADIGRITEIYADAVINGTATYELEPPAASEMAGRFDSLVAYGYPYIVAQDGAGNILGYAYASAFRSRPAYRFIAEDSIYVAPEAKGRGVGRLLLAALIEAVEALGFRQLVAVIGDGTAASASVRLHEKLGFRHQGRLEGSGYKHGRWLDTTFMRLEMNSGTAAPPDPQSLPERKYRQEKQG